MVYYSVEDYLNTEHRKPIKHYIEKGNKKKAMECVDYLLDKYRETLAMSKFVEEKIGKSYPKYSAIEMVSYVADKCKPINWDTMKTVFNSEDEENSYFCFDSEDEEE